MDKETELAYLKSILASSQDIVNVLETISAQFKSMEKASTGLGSTEVWQVDMVTVFKNWSTVFELTSKASSDDVTIITIPEKDSKSS